MTAGFTPCSTAPRVRARAWSASLPAWRGRRVLAYARRAHCDRRHLRGVNLVSGRAAATRDRDSHGRRRQASPRRRADSARNGRPRGMGLGIGTALTLIAAPSAGGLLFGLSVRSGDAGGNGHPSGDHGRRSISRSALRASRIDATAALRPIRDRSAKPDPARALLSGVGPP